MTTLSTKKRLLYPSVIIALCAAFLIYKYILQVYPSIMTDQLMQEFQIGGARLGNLAAMFFYSYLVTQLFVGVLIDKFGTRLLASSAIFVSALGVYGFSQAETLLMAELSRALMGIGVAFATVTYLKMAAVWFPPRYFALIGGLLATAAMLGAIFGEAPLAFLFHYAGWRNSLALIAVVGLLLAILFVLIVKNQPKQVVSSPHLSKPDVNWRNIKQVLLNKQNWLLTFYSGLAFSPLAVFGGLWGNPFLKESYHLPTTTAASLVSLSFIGLAIGGPVLGAIAEQLNSKNKVMSTGTLLALLTIIIALYLPLPIWLLAIDLFAFGFFTGVFMLAFAIGREINPTALAATVIAMINTGDAILGAITEPMIGKFLDLSWSGIKKNGIKYFSLQDFHLALSTLPIYLLLAFGLSLWISYLIQMPHRPSTYPPS